MTLVNDKIDLVEGEVEMMAGNRARAMELADRLEAHSRGLGLTTVCRRAPTHGCLSQR